MLAEKASLTDLQAFNPRSPQRAKCFKVLTWVRPHVFQSTLSTESEISRLRLCRLQYTLSIHALHRERNFKWLSELEQKANPFNPRSPQRAKSGMADARIPALTLSIHTLHRERNQSCWFRNAILYLSIHALHRERNHSPYWSGRIVRAFNPRSPQRAKW